MDTYHDHMKCFSSQEDNHKWNGWPDYYTLHHWGRGYWNTHQRLQNKTHVDPNIKPVLVVLTSLGSCTGDFFQISLIP